MKYYFAYGSNLNLVQMSMRCPTAKAVGASVLQDYQLIFNKHATIIPKEGSRAFGAVWQIDEAAEKELDFYEGCPTYYRKEYVAVTVNGEEIKAMVYIMNREGYQLPDRFYLDVILQGYEDIGLDVESLKDGIEYTKRQIGC